MNNIEREQPTIVSQDEWLVARKAHLEREKALTRLRDQVSAERRELHWSRLRRTTSSIPLAARKRLLTYSTDAVNRSSSISCSVRQSATGRRVAKAARSLLTM